MARLFIGPREQAFINDITKEFVADVVGQTIIYYPVSMTNTKVHEIYEEAIEKMFETPIRMGVLAGQPDRKNIIDNVGYRNDSSIEIYVQPRDLIDRGLEMFPGDFFVYGGDTYEVLTVIVVENIYGQTEYDRGVKLVGQLSKLGEFSLRDFNNWQNDNNNFEESTVQKKFVQQRGLPENEEGATNDFRQVRDRLGDEMAPIALGEDPRKIDEDEQENEAVPVKGSNFYHE